MVDSLPVAMVASLLVLAAIAGIATLGLGHARPMVSSASVDGQLFELANDGKALLASSPRDLLDPASSPGASKTISLSLPVDTGYVAFGSGEEEGTIVYEVHGDRKAIALGRVRLREGIENEGIMLPSKKHRVIEGGGRYQITIEYVYDRSLDVKYLIIY